MYYVLYCSCSVFSINPRLSCVTSCYLHEDNGANQNQIRIKYKIGLLPSLMIGNVLKDRSRYFLGWDVGLFLTVGQRIFSVLIERVSSENLSRASLKSTSSTSSRDSCPVWKFSLESLLTFFSLTLLRKMSSLETARMFSTALVRMLHWSWIRLSR